MIFFTDYYNSYKMSYDAGDRSVFHFLAVNPGVHPESDRHLCPACYSIAHGLSEVERIETLCEKPLIELRNAVANFYNMKATSPRMDHIFANCKSPGKRDYRRLIQNLKTLYEKIKINPELVQSLTSIRKRSRPKDDEEFVPTNEFVQPDIKIRKRSRKMRKLNDQQTAIPAVSESEYEPVYNAIVEPDEFNNWWYEGETLVMDVSDC